MKLTDAQTSLMYTALWTASEKYEEFAKVCAQEPAVPRLVEQFKQQARDTRELAQAINGADEITITTVD